jgi:hypothetical protein
MNYSLIFTKLLENTTNSYKYLYLKALTERVTQGDTEVSIDNLIIDMLVLAWYPSQYFRLSFGLQDQIGTIFKQQNFGYSSAIPITSSSFRAQLRIEIIKSIDLHAIRKKLADYVQFRLLTPFFADELRGKKDQVKNRLIFELSHSHFDIRFPLYKISMDKKSIVLNQPWCDFIKVNAAIIRSYQRMEWVNYLQKNNPNTPAIICKTEPPMQRGALAKQQKFWDTFIQGNTNEKCIYTGKQLITIKPSLDHFLPWSFVCHDRLWNLVPVNSNTNSSKSNNLPSLDHYLHSFIEQQSRAIHFCADNMLGWEKHADCYIQDLGFKNQNEILEEQLFLDKLSQTIESQYNLAKQLGFNDNWFIVN